MNTTAKEARENVVYVVEDGKVVETNLYDHVMKSAEETTTPRGVGMVLHIEETTADVWEDVLFDGEEASMLVGQETKYNVRRWGHCGKGSMLLDTFDTEEDADDYIFQNVYENAFARDDHRNTFYSIYKDAAIAELAESLELDFETVESIMKHEELKVRIIEKRDAKRREIEEKIKQDKETIVKDEVSKLLISITEYHKEMYSEALKLTGMDKNNAYANLMKKIIKDSGVEKVKYFWEDFRCLVYFLK